MADKRRVNILREGIKRMQLELATTERLAHKQHEKMGNPAAPVYITLLWLQDPSCFRWLRSFDQELQALPSVSAA